MSTANSLRRCRWLKLLLVLLAFGACSLPAASSWAAAQEHHNQFDLSHGNAGEKLEDPSELRSDLAIYTFVVFLLLLAILMKFAWRPIVEGLQKREQAIADNIEQARQSAEKANQTLRQYEAKLAAAAEETRQMLAEARRDAEAATERILAEAREQAQRERQRAVEDIQLAKDRALRELAEQTIDTAVNLASRMLRKEVDRQMHVQLIREALQQFPSDN